MSDKKTSKSAKKTEATGTARTDVQHSEASVAQLIANLHVGESYSYTKRIDFGSCDRDTVKDIQNRMRNTLAPAADRAKRRTGNVYTVEGGEIFTRTMDLLLVMVVTRVE